MFQNVVCLEDIMDMSLSTMVALGFQNPSSCWIRIEDYDNLNDLTFYAKSWFG
jgi:hypothetical protein